MRKIPAALLSLALTASLTAPLASAAGTGSTLPELDGHRSPSALQTPAPAPGASPPSSAGTPTAL